MIDEVERKKQRAYALRLRGWTYTQIAKQVGYSSKSGAHKAVHDELRELQAETREEAREILHLELDRLDRDEKMVRRLIDLNIERAEGGHKASGDIVLGGLARLNQLRERRAKYMALDAPNKTVVSGPDGGAIKVDLGSAHDELLARLARLAPASGAGTGDPGAGSSSSK